MRLNERERLERKRQELFDELSKVTAQIEVLSRIELHKQAQEHQMQLIVAGTALMQMIRDGVVTEEDAKKYMKENTKKRRKRGQKGSERVKDTGENGFSDFAI